MAETIFLCRDFLTQPGASVPGTNMYIMSIFMRHSLGFGIIGQTNFDLSSYEISSGLSASINQGLGFEYDVVIPSGTHAVTTSDIDRILSLKSVTHTRHNAGPFRITAVNTASNSVTIDYRSNEFPPVEPDIQFSIFEAENIISSTWRSGSNDGTGYNSNAPGDASKIILESPEALSSWQVRLTLESPNDINGAVVTPLSIAPGFHGNSTGDFVEGLESLHGAQFHNTTSSLYRGLTVGVGKTVATIWQTDQWRINLIGNADKGTVGYMLYSGSTLLTSWGCFGIAEDEPDNLFQYTEAEHIRRLFSLGTALENPSGSWDFNYQDQTNKQSGVGWGNVTYEPISCIASTYFPASNSGFQSNDVQLQFQDQATDNPWTNSTELLDVEVLVGTWDGPHDHSDGKLFEQQPRRLGRLPFFRQGRANYGVWSIGQGGHFVSSSWLHSGNGVFMEWGGPSSSDMIAGSNITLLQATESSSSTGLLSLSTIDPGEDPIDEDIEFPKDLDAVRYRRTYSYFRQEPRLIDFTKGGSNPSGGSK